MLTAALVAAAIPAAAAGAPVVRTPFDADYSVADLGVVSGINPAGLVLRPGTTDHLLIGHKQGLADGALYDVGVTRDAGGHITGFTGAPTRYADAANNRGGVAVGPGNVLFLARSALTAALGETKPGSSVTDKIIPLGAPAFTGSSVEGVRFVPPGLPGAGKLKLGGTPARWFDASVVPDGSGTYDLQALGEVGNQLLGTADPASFDYLAAGSPQFAAPALLMSERAAGAVSTFDLDADGNPVAATRRPMVTGVGNIIGGSIDPVSNDFLFTDGARVWALRGFAAPTATLKVVTHVVNDSGGPLVATDFNVHVRRGDTDVNGSPQQGSTEGTTYTLPANGAYTVGQDPVGHYTRSFGDDCDAAGTVTLAPGDVKTCTLTEDDDDPRLTVVKHVVNDQDGTATASDFTMHIKSGDTFEDVALASPFSGSEEPGTSRVLHPGSYFVSESGGPGGYATTIGGACGPDGGVGLAWGEAKTCTITNDDVGPSTVKLIKHVVNDNGGTRSASDFSVHLAGAGGGPDVDGSPQPGSEAGTTYTVTPDAPYQVSEDGVNGYVRTFSGDCDAEGRITVPANAAKRCTITNDDVASIPPGGCLTYGGFSDPDGLQLLGSARIAGAALRLTDNGGGEAGYAWYGGRVPVATSFTTDFDFNFTEQAGIGDADGPGADGITFAIQNTGVVATGAVGGALGYEQLADSVVIELDTYDNGPGAGDPNGNHVAVHTRGTAPNGPGMEGDSLLGVAALTPFLQDGLTHHARVVYDGAHLSVYVDDLATPALTVPIDLAATLALPDDKAFVGFTSATGLGAENHDVLDWSYCPEQSPVQPGTLEVVKHVVDDNGGIRAAGDFMLHVTHAGEDVAGSPQPGSEAGLTRTLEPGTYRVGEDAAPGYRATFSGDCDASGNVSVPAGASRTCTITNDDMAPKLTVVKHVVNDDGGTATAGQWTMHIGDAAAFAGEEAPGTTRSLTPGDFVVTESGGPTGYTQSFSGDCDPAGAVTLALGDEKTCIVTNDDVAPRLTVIKHVINDDGGTASAGDWTMHVGAAAAFPGEESPGTARTVTAGPYVVSESDGPAGYTASFSGACAADGTVMLAVGDDKTCTVTNDDPPPQDAPRLEVVKHVVNDNSGTKTASDFSLHVRSGAVDVGGSPRPGSEAGSRYTLVAGETYAVSEDDAPGYVRTLSGDCGPTGTITLHAGDDKTCTITNDDVQPVGPGSCIDFSGFSPAPGMQLLGNAEVVGSALRLTRNENYQAGYGWYGDRVSVVDPFTTDFHFRFTEPAGNGGGADGITFAIQNAGVVATGAVGGALGYQDLPNSVVVEFDSFDNGPFAGDPNDNHVAVHTRGTAPNGPGGEGDSLLGVAPLTPVLKDGETHHARVVYDGAHLTVYLDDLGAPALTVPIDLSQRLDLTAGKAFVGFTGATGAGVENQDVLDWKFCPDREPPPTASLKVVKHVVNGDGGAEAAGDFLLHVTRDGAEVDGSPRPGSEAGTMHTLDPGAYTVGEDAAAGYEATFSGACDADGHVTLAAGDSKTCTVTNDDVAPELTVVKHVVNDDGGSASAGDWTMHIGDAAAFPGAESPGTTRPVAAGAYALRESGGPSGYARSFSGDCDAQGHVTLAPGQKKTCTVTNDDVPEPPDSCPGTTAGRVFVTGHDPDFHGHHGAEEPSNEAGARHIIQRGITYVTAARTEPRLLLVTGTANKGGGYVDSRTTLAEAGYTFDVAHAADADDAALDLRTVDFAPYDAIVVASDFGGWLTQAEIDALTARSSDLLTYVRGGGGVVAFAESESRGAFGYLPFLVSSVPVTAAESGLAVRPFGAGLGLTDADVNGSVYHNIFSSAGALEVVDVDTNGTADTADDRTLSLAGELCAKLRVVKHVVTDDGGTATASDWSMHVDDGPGFPGAEDGTERAMAPGEHHVSESGGPPGYRASFSGDCDAEGTAVLAAGESRTCVITNDDIAPKLTVVKHVVNDDGGTASAGDWTMHIGEAAAFPGEEAPGTTRTVAAGAYDISESGGPDGYARSFSGDCDEHGHVTLAPGDARTCTVVNDDAGPPPAKATLKVVKHVVDDDGGARAASAFTLHVRHDGADVAGSPKPGSEDGSSYTLDAGAYSVAEDDAPGYRATFSGACDADGHVTLAAGDSKTCTVTNDDIAPQLTVVAHVVNDDGGTKAAEDFPMHIRSGGADVAGKSPFPGAESPGVTRVLAPGTYNVGPSSTAGYAVTQTGDCGSGDVTLGLGEHRTCTFTIDDIAPTLRVIKHVVNDDGGTATATGFSLHVKDAGDDVTGSPQPGSESGTPYTLRAGRAYRVSETGASGYSSEFSGACDDHGEITLAPGEQRTCTLTNDDVAPVADNCLDTQSGRVYVTGHDPDFHGHEGAPQSNEDGARHILQRAIAYTTRAKAAPKLLLVTSTEDQGPEFIDPRTTLAEAGYTFDVAHAAAPDAGARDVRTVDFGAYDGIVVASDFGGWLTQAEVDALDDRADDVEAFVTGGGGLVALAESQSDGEYGFLPFIVSALPTGEVESGLAVTPLGAQIGLTDADVNGSVYHAYFPEGGVLEPVDVDTRHTEDKGDDRVVSLAGELCSALTVVKHVVADDGGTAKAADFTMHLKSGGIEVAGKSPFAGAEAPGTTRSLAPGTFKVSESGGPAGYAATFSGACGPDGTVELAAGETATCTVTNDDVAPQLTVVAHVVNDDGGTKAASDFPMHIRSGGADVAGKSPFPGAESPGVTRVLAPGAYNVGPSSTAGYAVTQTGDCGTGDVTLGLGDHRTCTFVIDDIAPTLRVIKHVVNDDGGTATAANWTMHIRRGGQDVAGKSPFPGQEAPGTLRPLSAGSFVVSQSGGPAGYVATVSGDCAPDGSITLALGENRTCTITDDDPEPPVAPTLKVVTNVVNDDGGTRAPSFFAVAVRAAGVDVPGSPQPGSAGGTTYTLSPGAFTVVGSGGAGQYAATVSGACTAAGAVALAAGDAKVCTVTFDDIAPTLTVVKQVVNDDGGTAAPSAWTMHVRAGGVDVAGKSPFPGSAAGTTRTLRAGSYSVAETGGPSGYVGSISGDCDSGGNVSLALGQARTCTLRSDDVAPTLRVIKRVVNDDGGTRGPGDWTMHIRSGGSDVAGKSPFPGSAAGTARTLRAGAYTVGESGPGGYAGAIGGDCAASGAVTLAVGQAKTCTITNDDIAPPPTADLGVAKIASDTTPYLGDTVAYTLAVTNAGPRTASGAVLTDDVDGRLLPGATPAGCTASSLPGGATRLRCALGDLGAGASRSVTLAVRPLMACGFAGTSRNDRDAQIGSTDGDDVICGGAGADTFGGGRGDDTLYGLAPLAGLPGTVPNTAAVTSSTPDPNPANDTSAVSIAVAAGRDRGDDVDGGAGRDRLIGAAGADKLDGGAGGDTFDGGAGDDELIGGGGKDVLDGGRGRDELKGGPGSDRIAARDGTRDTVDCGGGAGDRATVDRKDRVKNCETVRRN